MPKDGNEGSSSPLTVGDNQKKEDENHTALETMATIAEDVMES